MTGVLKRVGYVFISTAGGALGSAVVLGVAARALSLLYGKSISFEAGGTVVVVACAAISALLGAFNSGQEAKEIGIEVTLVNSAAAWIVAGLIAMAGLMVVVAR
jgi:hypothetical protein